MATSSISRCSTGGLEDWSLWRERAVTTALALLDEALQRDGAFVHAVRTSHIGPPVDPLSSLLLQSGGAVAAIAAYAGYARDARIQASVGPPVDACVLVVVLFPAWVVVGGDGGGGGDPRPWGPGPFVLLSMAVSVCSCVQQVLALRVLYRLAVCESCLLDPARLYRQLQV